MTYKYVPYELVCERCGSEAAGLSPYHTPGQTMLLCKECLEALQAEEGGVV